MARLGLAFAFNGAWGVGGVFSIRFRTSSREGVGVLGMSNDLSSAKMKVEWAKAHIGDLHRLIASYAHPDNHTIVMKVDPASVTDKAFLKSEPVPSNFRMHFGDIVHNLRTALDHVAYVFLEGKVPEGERHFPFRETRASLKSTLDKGKVNAADAAVKKFILETLKPYRIDEDTGEEGNIALWAVNKLDNIDKHRKLLVTAAVSGIRFEKIRYVENIVFSDNVFIAPVGEDGQIFHIPRGHILHAEYAPLVQIRIGEAGVFTGEPLLETLIHLFEAVSKAVESFSVEFP